MEYRVYNDSCIPDKSERLICRELIGKQVSRLERFSAGYPKSLVVNIHFNSTSKGKYMVTAIVRLKQGTVLVKQSGSSLEAIIHSLFDRLKPALSKRLHKFHKETLRHKKNVGIQSFHESLPELLELKNEGSDKLLQDLLKLLLNDLAKYIRRRLRSAEMTSAISIGRFKIEELLDEIYLIVHQRLDEVPRDTNACSIWLYQLADDFLEDKFQELSFENENFERIETIVENEYRSLEEGYTVDDYENQPYSYSVNDLCYEDHENTLIDNLIRRLGDREIHQIIEKELAKLPLFKRTIMDLYLVDMMNIKEISSIRHLSESEVEAVIREVNKQLKRKLSNS